MGDPHELLVVTTPARVLGDADGGEQLTLPHGGLEEVDEEVLRRHGALTVGTRDDQLGIESEDRRAHVTGRIGVHERAADGAPVADLRIGDGLHGSREDGRVLLDQVGGRHLVVGGHGTDDEVVTLLADASELLDATEVDDRLRRVEAHPEDREQGLSAGHDLGLVASFGQSGEGVGHTRGRDIVESGGDHWSLPSPVEPGSELVGADSSKWGCAAAVVAVSPPAPWMARQTRSGVHGIRTS